MSMSWFVLGAALGRLNAWTQWWTVARLRPDAPRRAVAWILGGAVLRWALSAGLLIAALGHGLVSGLLACAGLGLACWSLVCWWNWGRPPFEEL